MSERNLERLRPEYQMDKDDVSAGRGGSDSGRNIEKERRRTLGDKDLAMSRKKTGSPT